MVVTPTREEAKSNLAMFGRFLLSTDVIRILSEIPLGKSNELWLTDAVPNTYVAEAASSRNP